MTIGYELRPSLVLNSDVLKKILGFFQANDFTGGQRSRVASTDSNSSLLDADKPAGVDEWQDLEPEEKIGDSIQSSTAWLSNCLICPFASLDYLLIVGSQRYVLLNRKPSDESAVNVVSMKSVASLAENEDECITCCEVFGLGSSRKSENMDCVVVALGLSTGRVEFYTEKGTLLFFERFSNSKPIITISFDQFTGGQLLTVATKEEIFFVTSESLRSVLSQSKSAIAKGEKTAEELSDLLELECERLEIEGRPQINDLIFTGIRKTTALERYVTASLDGVQSRVESSASPNYITVFVNTDRSLGSFVWYPEGSNVNIWSEAVSKIASSVIPHFGFRKLLGISSGSNKKTVLSVSKGSALVRSSFDDDRIFVKLARSPLSRGLIAGADNLARVVLIDIRRRIITRIWKGYRDASVTWVTATRDEKRVVFLVIFAPRLSLLEVWLPYGDRVAAQRVDPKGILLNDNGCLILCGQKEIKEESRSFFINSEGVVSEIVVPFHLALSKYQSGEAQDQILLENIVSDNGKLADDELLQAFNSLNTDSAKTNALLSLIQSAKSLENFEIVLNNIQQIQCSDNFQHKLNNIVNYLDLFKRLIHYYKNGELTQLDYPFPFNDDAKSFFKLHSEMGEYPVDQSFDLQVIFSLIEWNDLNDSHVKQNLKADAFLQFAELIFLPILNGFQDPSVFFQDISEKLPFSTKFYAEMFVKYILNSTFRIDVYFGNMVNILSKFEEIIPDDMATWEKMGLESYNISRCIILFVALFIIRKINWVNKKEISESSDHDHAAPSGEEETEVAEAAEDWDALDPVAEHADSTMIAMHICWISSSLKSDCSYLRMLQKGPGYIREQIASWLVQHDVDPDNLDDLINQSEQTKDLMNLLPLTTSKDLLYADIAWELASFWFKKQCDRLDSLKNSLSFLSVIEDLRLKHGLSRLIWDKFVCEPVRLLSNVIERNGRTPTDRESRNALQLPESCLLDFVNETINLLNITLETTREELKAEKVPVDHLLQVACSHPPASAGFVTSLDSLVHVAHKQRMANYHLLLHHLQLYSVYRLMFMTNVSIEPKNKLFCEIGARAFDHPLDSHPLIPEEVADNYMKNRHDFLTKVAEEGSDTERKMARDLAFDWGLNADSIALMQLIQYLRLGKDEEAKLELGGVRSEQVGERLARILAARVLCLVSEEKRMVPKNAIRFLTDLAGDELVEWDGSWRDAVNSLADLVSFIALEPKDVSYFLKISNITKQYWGIKCYNG